MARIMITEAHSVGNLTIEMTFNDNTIQRVNIGEFIHAHPHPQYDKYLDEHEFLMLMFRVSGSLLLLMMAEAW